MHALLEELPVVRLYFPAAQEMHALMEELPELGLYLPAAQGVVHMPSHQDPGLQVKQTPLIGLEN
jgi:hypothetical protein